MVNENDPRVSEAPRDSARLDTADEVADERPEAERVEPATEQDYSPILDQAHPIGAEPKTPDEEPAGYYREPETSDRADTEAEADAERAAEAEPVPEAAPEARTDAAEEAREEAREEAAEEAREEAREEAAEEAREEAREEAPEEEAREEAREEAAEEAREEAREEAPEEEAREEAREEAPEEAPAEAPVAAPAEASAVAPAVAPVPAPAEVEERERPADLMPGAVPAEPLAGVWVGDTAQSFQHRWREVQLRFVDDPRAAVAEARALTTEVMDALISALGQRRDDLDGWRAERGEDTEELRVTLRRYRDFLQRMLDL